MKKNVITKLSLMYLSYMLLLHSKWMMDILFEHTFNVSKITTVFTLSFLTLVSIFVLTKDKVNIALDELTTLFVTIYIYYVSIILVNEIYIYLIYRDFDKNAVRNILVSLSLMIASSNLLYTRFYLSKIKSIVRLYIVMALLPAICSLLLTLPYSTTFFIRSLVLPSQMSVPYQTYGDTIVIFYSILLFNIRRKQQIMFLFLITTLGLLTLGSKASFIGFVLSNIFLYYLYLYKKNLKHFSMGLITLALLCILILPVVKIYSEKYSKQNYGWVFNVVAERTQERSFSTRKPIEEYNAKTRIGRLLFGNYKHEIYNGMGQGSYTHNLLDLLDQMGICLFVFYVAYMFYNFIVSVYLYLKNSESDMLSSNIILLAYWMILFTFVRSSGTLFLTYVLYLSILNLKKTVKKDFVLVASNELNNI